MHKYRGFDDAQSSNAVSCLQPPIYVRPLLFISAVSILPLLTSTPLSTDDTHLDLRPLLQELGCFLPIHLRAFKINAQERLLSILCCVLIVMHGKDCDGGSQTNER